MALQNLVNRLRQFRSLHKWIGISVVAFMLITSVTGVLLGWKKKCRFASATNFKRGFVRFQ
jgi:hypothetical protein